MRTMLVSALKTVWEESIVERAMLSPRSAAGPLDAILRARPATPMYRVVGKPGKIGSQTTPKSDTDRKGAMSIDGSWLPAWYYMG